MPSHRAERINADFQREIAMVINRMKDPRLDTMLEVVRVKVTTDLAYAKVYIASVSGGEAAAAACKVLQGAEGHVKSELAHTMRVRKIPALTFVPDDSVDYYNRIESIIKDIHKNDKED